MIFTSECAGSQVDVIFPFDHDLQATFGELETEADHYYTSRAPLAEIYESLRESGLSRCVFAGLTASVVLPTDVVVCYK
jgi:hypothetical protein